MVKGRSPFPVHRRRQKKSPSGWHRRGKVVVNDQSPRGALATEETTETTATEAWLACALPVIEWPRVMNGQEKA